MVGGFFWGADTVIEQAAVLYGELVVGDRAEEPLVREVPARAPVVQRGHRHVLVADREDVGALEEGGDAVGGVPAGRVPAAAVVGHASGAQVPLSTREWEHPTPPFIATRMAERKANRSKSTPQVHARVDEARCVVVGQKA